jgi:pSer/pThr/pTyr-binding forkhead associated (FHA) protein
MLKLQFKDNASRSLWLAGEKLTLGSDADNDVMLSGLGIEGFHASINIHESGVKLLSESGSCFVNDMPVDDVYSLNPGDELRIGQHRMLILTAQQADQIKKAATEVAAKSAVNPSGTGWSLQAQHSKLKDIPYIIAKKSILGRSKDCDLAVPYKLLSRHHVEFTVRDGQLYLRDLGSSNGSFVNGSPVAEARLQAGDKITLAKLVFEVQGPIAETELNKTMLRPAVDISAELKKTEHQASGNSLLPETTDGEAGAEQQASSTDKSNKLFPLFGLSLLVTGISLLVCRSLSLR